ncbi:response regulator transcription factor [Mucilaginibacter achroorhodeus]|uniref:Response regulator transcription factor n=1 Tax=Mucilaginibacter achroorhodeus TaxID=2599294 RepID=A0A563UBL5_9SPHI|nr:MULTISPECIES: response regulator transcription factor [Mucilaginibacter]QXV66201.1 response regulator transcription factor [Mucilaginibacter sp. 21P]TWR28683.1 response regulator transcription factor [Mucilaginibacter achroorhodeus]
MAKKILIVDDNELIVEVMSYILINCGYDVFSLYNGEHVIEEVKHNHPDLLIMDAKMPGMDGRDICQILKMDKATKGVPVIICSSEDNLADSLKQRGAPDDILQKPFDMTALINKVKMQLAA